MDKDILFFVKFGKKCDLENMIKGSMHFSNVESFRKLEKEQLKKGQGDIHDGIFGILASDATITPNNSTDAPTKLNNQLFKVDFEENKGKAVFCITAGTRDNCSYYNDDLHYKIKFSNLQANLIKEQFTKADSVLLIKRPKLFIKNVFENIGYDCYSNKAFYYNEKHFTENNLYDFHEIFTGKEADSSKITEAIITTDNVHKFLLCKDIFFLQQQEYRFILPKTKISKPQNLPIAPIIDEQIYSLDEFFAGVEVSIASTSTYSPQMVLGLSTFI